MTRLTFRICRWLAAGMLSAVATVPAAAQQPGVHYFHSANQPPGTVGAAQAMRGGPTANYLQPVEIKAPKGALVSVAVNGEFTEPKDGAILAGMLVGPVYRLRVANLKLHETDEVYPTIELVSRLHPPPGQALRFPIPIELSQEDLERAISGQFVTRVVYLENPGAALPLRQEPNHAQRYFDAPPGADPLRVADELGRPMAIIRMGSRVPDLARETTNLGFNYGAPPVVLFDKPPVVPRKSGLEEPIAPSVKRKPE